MSRRLTALGLLTGALLMAASWGSGHRMGHRSGQTRGMDQGYAAGLREGEVQGRERLSIDRVDVRRDGFVVVTLNDERVAHACTDPGEFRGLFCGELTVGM